ncbi:MAG: T9SS type A sorting domain-containing protein [Bacteroidota bacterium]|nr:T9SS type A sorting domain-containing protein [Bacteroidota bacterium]
MKINLLASTILLLFSALTNRAVAQFTLTYSFASVTTSTGRTDPTVTPKAAGLVADSFRAATTLSANSGASGRFNFTQWPTGATNGSNAFAGYLDPKKYYEVKITPLTGYQLSINSIAFTIQRSATGVRQWAVRSSIDSFAANLPAAIEPANTNITVADSNKFQIVDRATTGALAGSKATISNIQNTQNAVTFRFYGFNAESTAGTFSINAVNINGSISAVPAAPILTINPTSLNFPATPANTVSAAKTYTLKGENLTGTVSIATTQPYFVSVDDRSYTTNLTLTAADVINNKTIYVKFSPTSPATFTGSITNSSNNAAQQNVIVTGDGIDPGNLSFNFDNCSAAGSPGSGFMPYNVTGPQVWSCSAFGRNNTKGVDMNGYSGGAVENEDWLISPRLAISSLSLPILKFWSRGEFTGPSLQLLVSTDYDGSSNPNAATWTNLNASFPSTTNTWTLTDGIDLSPYKNYLNIYIAFKYISSVEAGAARWTLDDIEVSNRTNVFTANPTQLKFPVTSVSENSAGLPFTVKSIGYGNLTVMAPAGFQVSLDSTTYASSITISQALVQSDKKLYVRFSPTVRAIKTEGFIRFTATALDSSAIAVAGSSYSTTETVDIGCYNLSFFGSNAANNPTPDKITTQIANISTVLNSLNLDIAGVEEISNDSAFNVLLTKLPNRKSVVSGRWSYSFNPPDPNFPPQKTGFIYDTTTVKLISSRDLFVGLYDSARGSYPQKLPNYPGGTPSSFWASGRLPFLAIFDVTLNGVTKRIHVIDIHAKSASDVDSYNRRVYDVKVLKDTLDAYYKNENLVIVGDYNDRVIGSIYSGSPNSPYKPFVDDNAKYTVLTLPLDQAGRTSFIGGTGLIDQITITNPLSSSYIANSTDIEDPRAYISNYNANTASDHLPVYSRFSFTAVLPVTLINFDAKPKGGEVQVTWATVNEFNNSRFIVERSDDAFSFSSIGSVPAQGNSNGQSNYNFTDKLPLSGTSYYRLRQVDIDGKYTFSNTVAVNLDINTSASLKIYPNPVTKFVRLSLNSTSTTYEGKVTSATGLVQISVKGDINQVNKQINDRLAGLSKGVYIITLASSNDKFVTRFLKQ